jgi:CheY-like chemotaxis protein
MEFALSAAAALERVKTIAAPSLILILSDINMPGMTGLEMLPKVKELRPDVPVIMITAYGDDGVIPGIRVATKTGNHVMAADLAELWAAAERIGGKAIDPLDPRFTCADAEGENRSR